MSVQPASAIYCSQCGQAFQASELATIAGVTVCAGCKPAYLRRLQEGSSAGLQLRYMGFWIRYLALLIDGIVLGVVMVPLFIVLIWPAVRASMVPGRPPVAMPASMVIPIAILEFLFYAVTVVYRGWMVGRYGATLGKMAIGARIVASDGSRLTMRHAFGRSLAEVITDFTFGIGYLLAAFDGKKRALHDRIAGTLVIAK